jgi:hypothetical protein
LFNNICTYHNIVKNSVLKVIDLNSTQDLNLVKSDVCYFKNLLSTSDGLPVCSIKLRKRMQLEYALRSKMQLLKRDWREFLRTNYPELFTQNVDSEDEQLNGKKDAAHFHMGSNEKGSGKVMDENGFILQVEEMLDNSRLIGRESLKVPSFVFYQRAEDSKETLSDFYDQILRVYEDFSDFQVLKQTEMARLKSDSYLYFTKLVTK